MKLLATLAFVTGVGAMALPGQAEAREIYRRPVVAYHYGYRAPAYGYAYAGVPYNCGPGYVAPVYVGPVHREYVPEYPRYGGAWRDRGYRDGREYRRR